MENLQPPEKQRKHYDFNIPHEGTPRNPQKSLNC